MYGHPVPPVPLDQPDYRAGFGAATARFWRKTFDGSGRAGLREFGFGYLGFTLAFTALCAPLMLALVIVLVLMMLLGLTFWMGNPNATPDDVLQLGIHSMAPYWWLAYPALLILIGAPGMVTLTIRRLHDTGRSGGWALLWLAPYGWLVLTVMCFGPSKTEGLRFDRNPYPILPPTLPGGVRHGNPRSQHW